MKVIILILTILWYLQIPALAQEPPDNDSNTEFTLSTRFYFSDSEHPFWHYANQYGVLGYQTGFSILNEAGIYNPSVFKLGGFNIDAGAHGVLRVSDGINSAHFQQFFGRITYGALQLKAGRFHHESEILEPTLSTGSMMIGRNSTPIPLISAGTQGYVDIPYLNGYVQFKAVYSDGILESNRYVKNTRIHHKSFHFKYNILMFEIMTGFIHNVQWGGIDPERGRLPMSFNDYLRIVTGRPAGEGSGATEFEITNRLGNTIASYDGSMIVHLNNGHQLLAYRQIYLEDSISLTTLRSYMDGLFGLGYRFADGGNWLNAAILEYVNTIRQDSMVDAPRGRGNYYNHYVYQSGWSYHGTAIGNPLLTFDPNMDRFTNNRILGWHIGARGSVSNDIDYTIKLTYSRNYGICRDQIIRGTCIISPQSPADDNMLLIPRSELRMDQYSILLETGYQIPGFEHIRLHSSLAIDIGDLLGNRVGLMVGISYSDILRR